MAIGFVRVKEESKENTKILINELVLMILMYHIMLFTDYVPDPEARYTLGYSQIGFLGLGLFYNMQDLLKQSFGAIKKIIKRRLLNRQAVKYLNNVTRKRNKEGKRKIDGSAFNKRRSKVMDKAK